MFHAREVDWSSYGQGQPRNNTMVVVVVDTRNGDRRLLAQSPIPMQYIEHPTPDEVTILEHFPARHLIPTTMIEDDESDGYNTPDEEFDNGGDSQDREMTTSPERRTFTTPCGQTYWVDTDNRLYTNESVEVPIGFWCHLDQCVYLNDGNDNENDSETDDDDSDYDPPPTPPPLYEESESLRGSPATTDSDLDNEVEGETIVMTIP
jgi:hypothetical protein